MNFETFFKGELDQLREEGRYAPSSPSLAMSPCSAVPTPPSPPLFLDVSSC
jgi:hypothetical protein